MARRKSAEPVNEAAQAADGQGIYLDPALVEIREVEAARNSVEIAPREDATLDPVLALLREQEIKRGDRVIQ